MPESGPFGFVRGALSNGRPYRDPASRGALDASLDEIRNRFGPAAVTRAVLLGRDEGLQVPLLPD